MGLWTVQVFTIQVFTIEKCFELHVQSYGICNGKYDVQSGISVLYAYGVQCLIAFPPRSVILSVSLSTVKIGPVNQVNTLVILNALRTKREYSSLKITVAH